VTALTDKTAARRTDTTYDFRGNINTVSVFGTLLADGTGATTDVSKTTYVYDQFGKLLSRVSPVGPTETNTYDGLGRLIASTDFAGKSTTVGFDDAGSKTILTLANGLTRTSTYNLAGELISFAEAGSGLATSTTAYAYDAGGRLRMVTGPTGQKSYSLYDEAGRKVADIAADGTLTEYGYTSTDLLNKTVQYAGKLSAVQLASSGRLERVASRHCSVNPSAHRHDQRPLVLADL